MPRLSKDKWIEIINRYQGGETAISLAREFGCSNTAISSMLKRKKIHAHDKSYVYRKSAGHSVNETAFDVISPESSYWIGFLMADGCVTSGNTVSLVLAEKDEWHIEKFKRFIGASNKITTHIPTRYSEKYKETFASKFAVRSARICEALSRYGIVPNKTARATASKLLASNKDFWRGVIDGDGYIALRHVRSYFNAHPRINAWSKPRYIARIELVGSEPLLNQFKTFVESVTQIAGFTIRPHKSIFRISLSGKTAEAVISTLYTDACEGLDRKMNAAQNIRNIALGDRVTARRCGQNLLGSPSTTDEARTEEMTLEPGWTRRKAA